MSTRVRVYAMTPGGYAGDELGVERLDDVAAGFLASPYAHPKEPYRGSLHVQVMRWLTADEAAAGAGGRRLSPRGMEALLAYLRAGADAPAAASA